MQKQLAAHIKDFEPSDVQHTNEIVSREFGVQSDVQSVDNPLEQIVVHSFTQGTGGIMALKVQEQTG